MEPVPPSPIAIDNFQVKPAGAWSRLWASAIDAIYVGFPFIFIYLIATLANIKISNFIYGCINIISIFVYEIYFNITKGWTIGKDAYGLKVVTYQTDQKITLQQAIIRELAKYGIAFIPIIGLFIYIANGFMIIFSKEKRGLHDKAANSQVVRYKKAWSMKKQLIGIALPLAVIIILGAWLGLSGYNNNKIVHDYTPLPTPSHLELLKNSEIDTSTWTKYENQEYKFSLKYPSNWNFKETNPGIFLFSPNAISDVGLASSSLTIFTHKGSTSQLSVELFRKDNPDAVEKNVQIGNIPATKFEYGLNKAEYYFTSRDIFYNISMWPYPEDKNTMDTIISTFILQ